MPEHQFHSQITSDGISRYFTVFPSHSQAQSCCRHALLQVAKAPGAWDKKGMISNSTKVWIFIVVSSLLLLMFGYQVAERLGLLVGFVIAVILNFFVFFYGESPVLKNLNAQPLRGQDPWGVRPLVERFSDHVGVDRPEVFMLPLKTQTAFCLNHAWRKSSIALSSGLLNSFSPEDLEAVIAYQICYLQKLDTFASGVTFTLANALIGLGHLLDHFWPPNYFLTQHRKQTPFLYMLAPLAWAIVKLASGHKKFYLNDLQASELIHDRFRLAEVLWKLEGLAQTQPLKVPPGSSHLFMVNPEGFRQKNFWLRSHPTIQKRLQKLMGYYPI
jgi:heat shock protein HtpX